LNAPTRKPALDLTRNHFVRAIGDLVCVGTWVMNEAQEDYEPCLAILPRYRRKGGFRPCCVALSSIWQYNEPAYLAMASMNFARLLGMDDCMSNAHKIGELIHSHIGDLVKMPPNPTQSIIVADATYTIDGRTHSAQVLDHQPLAQA
jgi:hypothetical protein